MACTVDGAAGYSCGAVSGDDQPGPCSVVDDDVVEDRLTALVSYRYAGVGIECAIGDCQRAVVEQVGRIGNCASFYGQVAAVIANGPGGPITHERDAVKYHAAIHDVEPP
ncbi:hypothetical protein D3C78_739950 [compost metagenome]